MITFQRSMLGRKIRLVLSSGKCIEGLCAQLTLNGEILIDVGHGDGRLISVSREAVEACTITDDKERKPKTGNVWLTRCIDQLRGCEGVRYLGSQKRSFIEIMCKAKSKTCKVFHADFFKLGVATQAGLLSSCQLDEYPKTAKELDEELRSKKERP